MTPIEFEVDGANVEYTYSRPVFNAAQPYAVVESRGHDIYAVSSADSIEQAMVVSDARLQAGAVGIRVYLRCVFGFAQVHLPGEAPWPTHQQCVEQLEFRRFLLDCQAEQGLHREGARRIAAHLGIGPPRA